MKSLNNILSHSSSLRKDLKIQVDITSFKQNTELYMTMRPRVAHPTRLVQSLRYVHISKGALDGGKFL